MGASEDATNSGGTKSWSTPMGFPADAAATTTAPRTNHLFAAATGNDGANGKVIAGICMKECCA